MRGRVMSVHNVLRPEYRRQSTPTADTNQGIEQDRLNR